MRTLTRLLPVFTALALLGACRDRASSDGTSSVDSAFARDIELAQRQAPPQAVFNDAPLGGSAAAASEPAAPARSPARTPRPTPTPRRESPRAPVTRAPQPTPPAPVERAPAAAPGGTAGVIGAGTRVGMTLNDRPCTTALVGDKFTATVASTTVGTNGAVIPAGATVVLEVTSVDRADPIEASRIHFHVRAIDVNGESYPGEGDVATLSQMETERVSSGSSDRTKVVGGAVAGAVLGRILGRSTRATVIGAAAGAAAGGAAARRSQSTQACLAAGSSLQLTLSREIVMRREGKI